MCVYVAEPAGTSGHPLPASVWPAAGERAQAQRQRELPPNQ